MKTYTLAEVTDFLFRVSLVFGPPLLFGLKFGLTIGVAVILQQFFIIHMSGDDNGSAA